MRQGVDGVMRQSHRAGGTPFVDDAGQTAPIVDRESEARYVYLNFPTSSAWSFTFSSTSGGTGSSHR